jgi:hypothetical protein
VIKETISWDVPHLYISIDGPKNLEEEMITRAISEMLDKYKNYTKTTIWINDENLGLSKNITHSISKVLISETNLIVIEDDIAMTKSIYLSISRILVASNHEKLGAVGGFSAIPAPPKALQFLFKNKFRPSTRINIWGWGIRKEAWNLYERELSRVDFREVLNNSVSWNRLPARIRNIWLGRFIKVSENPNFTWDFQLQFMSFRYDLINYLPRFRAVDNLGFESPSSTNTKLRRSHYYVGLTDYRRIQTVEKNRFISWLFDQVELYSDLYPKIFSKFKFFRLND